MLSPISVLGNSLAILHVTNKVFLSQFRLQWSVNTVKVLACKFQECLGAFIMLLSEGSLETGLFRHWRNHVFRSLQIRKYLSYESHFFFFFGKSWKFQLDFENAAKKSEKVFCFRHNCIWIGCVKLSLLRREYLPSALSVLGNSLEILHITNRNFLKVNCLHSDQ